jgi:hypothetical protein
MTETKHTPGPWEIGDHMQIWSDHCDGPLAETIPNAKPGVNESNARLIAAAPELLAACEGVLGVLNHGTPTKEDGTPNTHWKHIDIIRAVIAKATGEES